MGTPPDHSGGVLARLVGDVEAFESEHWGRTTCVRHGNAGSFHDVWSLASLDDFIASAPRRPLIRLVRDGSPIETTAYTSTVRLGGSDFADVIDPKKLARELAAGATVVAQSLHRTHPPVARFVARLIDEISHPAQANAYLTPPDSTGLSPHSDRHDVFVVQVHGTKRWTVDGIGEVELSDGDVMYVPAGARHSAASTTSASLHLTIGVLRVTYRSVLRRLIAEAPASLDDPLPLRYRDPHVSFDQALSVRLDDVAALLRNADATQIVAAERSRQRQVLPGRDDLTRSIAELELDDSAVIVRGTRTWTVSDVGSDRVSVDDGQQRLVLPHACRSAIEQIESGEATPISALRGLDSPSQLVVARRMLAAGLCELSQ